MATKVSRNEACPCGSGKKYKHCCLPADERADALWNENEYVPERAKKPRDPWSPYFGKGSSTPNDGKVLCQAIAPQKPQEIYRDDAHQVAAPPNFQRRRQLDYSKPITRIEVHYAFEEMLGRAEVTYHFPVKQLILLEHDSVLQADRLKPGMRFRIESGEIATVTRVGQPRVWEAPPPVQEGDLCRRRIVGSVERVGFSVMDLVIAGIKITTTPGHRFWSATHDDWRPAGQLRAGEFLRSPIGEMVPIEDVSVPRHGAIKVYNLEIEQFNNYYVGGETQAVWVHNGLAGGCGVPLPAEVTEAEAEAIAAGRMSVRTARELGIVAPPDHHIFPQSRAAWFEARGINVDEFTVTLDQATHDAIHFGGGPGKGGGWWNDTLMARLGTREAAAGRMLNPAEIMEEGQWMLNRAGLQDLSVHPWNSTK